MHASEEPVWVRWWINTISLLGGIAMIAFGVYFTLRCAHLAVHRTPVLQLVVDSEFNNRFLSMYLFGSLYWLFGIVLAGHAAWDIVQLLRNRPSLPIESPHGPQ
jgi:hypothetical protein